MNRRKKTSSIGFPSLVLLAIAAVIISSGGISYVVIKNKQITALSEIDEVRRQMAEHKDYILTHEIQIRRILAKHDLKQRLLKNKSRLREIEHKEFYRPPGEERAIAKN